MKVKLIFLLFFTAAILWLSCQKNDRCENRNGDYSHGVFVVNEGPFGGTGSITWFDPATGQSVQDVYESENCGASLGQFVQSMSFWNGLGYIVVNGANRIVLVDGNSFLYQGVIEGFFQPRYFLPIDNRFAYVSQWGADGLSGTVAKVDLAAKRIVKTISVGSGPEKMLLKGDRVYVANSGGYGQDSTIVEINTSNDEVVARHIIGGKNPASLIADGDDIVYLCKGYYLDPVIRGRLGALQNGIQAGIDVAAFSDDLEVGQNGEIYFAGPTQVYKVDKNGGNFTVQPFIQQPCYGFAVDKANNRFYCADARDFSSAGAVSIYNLSGDIEQSFTTGVSPGEILFK